MARTKGARDRQPRRRIGQDVQEEIDRLIAKARREAIAARAQRATR